MNDQKLEQTISELVVSVARENHIQISPAPNGPLENIVGDQWFYDYRSPKIVLTRPNKGLDDFVEVTDQQTPEILAIELRAAFDRLLSKSNS